MARYAADTTVSTERSQAEIERTLQRYGADQFARGWDGNRAFLAFRLRQRAYRMILQMPDPGAREFTHARANQYGSLKERSKTATREAWEQACRQRWRALALVIKAKLEAAEAGITTLEQEFLPALVMPNGQTVAEWAEPQIASGTMPRLLLPAGGE